MVVQKYHQAIFNEYVQDVSTTVQTRSKMPNNRNANSQNVVTLLWVTVHLNTFKFLEYITHGAFHSLLMSPLTLASETAA
jgi:hypothetical protein